MSEYSAAAEKEAAAQLTCIEPNTSPKEVQMEAMEAEEAM